MGNRRDHFSTDHLLTTLGRRTTSGVQVILLAQGLKFLVQMLSLTVLSRLLRPEDFGNFVLVSGLLFMFAPLSEAGLSAATVQSKSINHGQVNLLFWVNLSLGGGLCLVALLMAPMIAIVYDRPALIYIAIPLSFSFLISAAAIQSAALLRRKMNFQAIAFIDVLSVVFGFFVGVAFALQSAGAVSLVAMALASGTLNTLATVISCGWMPSRPKMKVGARRLMTFGLAVSIGSIVQRVQEQITTIFMGFIASPGTVGQYNRAQTLTMIPLVQILVPLQSVLQPVFARLHDQPEKFRVALLDAIRRVSYCAGLVLVILNVSPDLVVEIALGNQWGKADEFLRILSLLLFLSPISGIVQTGLVAAGYPDVLRTVRFYQLAITLFALLVGQLWGPSGLVYAYVVSGLLAREPIMLFYGCRTLPITITDLMKHVAPASIMATVLILCLSYLREFTYTLGAGTELFFITALASIGCVLIGSAFPEIRRDIAFLIARNRN